MENLNENVGGKIEIEFQDWLDTMNDKDYPERLTLETVIEYSQDTLRDYDLDDWIPQGQSTSESKKIEDFDLKKYLAENKLLKEVNYKNPDTVMENMEDYLEQVYEEGEKDHMDDMMNTFKALSKLASQYMKKM